MLRSFGIGLLLSLLFSLYVQDDRVLLQIAIVIGTVCWLISALLTVYLFDPSASDSSKYPQKPKNTITKKLMAVKLFLTGLPLMLMSFLLYMELY
ncbi:hypothetical protein [Brevibacillus daliensis]|uniref:hypothetical protein n=1 Tax=Brevibacillus daliensis TaxID=2892995 RepID=UPI001E56DF17|nr:hypothetical protein [Brevibacillus daliensis]